MVSLMEWYLISMYLHLYLCTGFLASVIVDYLQIPLFVLIDICQYS